MQPTVYYPCADYPVDKYYLHDSKLLMINDDGGKLHDLAASARKKSWIQQAEYLSA